MNNDEQQLLEFPCRFPIKAFGEDTDDFERTVYELVAPHVPELSRSNLSRNHSSGGRYRAVTIDIMARSQDQLDAIYRDLTANQSVLMAL